MRLVMYADQTQLLLQSNNFNYLSSIQSFPHKIYSPGKKSGYCVFSIAEIV